MDEGTNGRSSANWKADIIGVELLASDDYKYDDEAVPFSLYLCLLPLPTQRIPEGEAVEAKATMHKHNTTPDKAPSKPKRYKVSAAVGWARICPPSTQHKMHPVSDGPLVAPGCSHLRRGDAAGQELTHFSGLATCTACLRSPTSSTLVLFTRI
jgi:hypothetical protein